MTDEERFKAAYDIAIEKTKQLITLATGILAVTISFNKDILGGAVAWTAILLFAAWVLYLVSIVFGVSLLGKFAAELQAEPLQQQTLRKPDIENYAKYQKNLFIAGVCFTIGFGASVISTAMFECGGLFCHLGSKP